MGLLKDVLEEADGSSIFGGAPGGGSGKFSYAQTAGAKTWAPSSPVHRKSTSDSLSYGVKNIADEESDKAQTAGLVRPYPLETLNEHLVESYLQLGQAKILLDNCLQYNTIVINDAEKKAILQHLTTKIEKVREMVKGIAEEIDRVVVK